MKGEAGNHAKRQKMKARKEEAMQGFQCSLMVYWHFKALNFCFFLYPYRNQLPVKDTLGKNCLLLRVFMPLIWTYGNQKKC
jgi:hypothetical protein